MPAISVRPFEPRDTTPAARLLAARHSRDRARLPVLRADMEAEAPCAAIIERLAGNARASGVVAVSAAGEVLGFLFGEKMTLSPTAFGSMYVPPHSIAIPIDGHAVHSEADATTVYRRLYASLAEQWVKTGFFEHQTHIVPGDRAVEEAWVNLGFGRGTTAAVRGTGPVTCAARRSVEIHQASSEDFAVISALSDALTAFHSRAPIFWPLLTDPRHGCRRGAPRAAGRPPQRTLRRLRGREAGGDANVRAAGLHALRSWNRRATSTCSREWSRRTRGVAESARHC